MAKKIYLIAGEASGDARGAELMRALLARDPALLLSGAGGPQMRAVAGDAIFEWTDQAVLGVWEVAKKWGYFKKQFARMLADVARLQPDAILHIDYPGFNLRFAKAAKQQFPGIKTIYYISPQVWAWNRARIPKMARFLDLMLCIFPFEKPLYEQSGLRTVFVGHPMRETLAAKRIADPRDPQLVGLFPGSREREVRKIFPTLLAAAQRLRKARPDLLFEASAASPQLAAQMRALVLAAGEDASFCRITIRASHELMQRAAVGIVCSGTATLEAAFFGLPLCIIYKVTWLTWTVGRQLVRVPFLGMPNVLAGREIAREFLQDAATPAALAAEIARLLGDHAARENLQRELAAVIALLGEPGAATRAADAVLELLCG